MKDSFKVTTRTIVAAGLGAAIFMLLFMYVKIPSWVPETQFQTAYGLMPFSVYYLDPLLSSWPLSATHSVISSSMAHPGGAG